MKINNTERFLTILATLSVLFEVLDGRDPNIDDFTEAIDLIGFDAAKFGELPPLLMIYYLAEKLVDIKLTPEIIKELLNDEQSV